MKQAANSGRINIVYQGDKRNSLTQNTGDFIRSD